MSRIRVLFEFEIGIWSVLVFDIESMQNVPSQGRTKPDAGWARFTASIPVSTNFGRSRDFELPWLQPGILLCMLCILLWTLGNAKYETVGMQVWSRCNPEAWNILHLNIVGDLGVFTFATSCVQCSFLWRPEAFMPGLVGVTPLHLTHQHLSFLIPLSLHLCSAVGSSHPFNINHKVCLTNGVTKFFGWSAVPRAGGFIFAARPLHGHAARTHLGLLSLWLNRLLIERKMLMLRPNCRFK